MLGEDDPLAPVPLGLLAPMLPEFPFLSFSLQVSEIMSTLETVKVFPELPLDAAELFEAPLSHIPLTATSWPACADTSWPVRLTGPFFV